ncbi:hypothetical protein C5B92_16175 [Rathayibacter sp. AY1A4]|uniref:hypothetical protein n=1 Tax=Rathayibacter sp. AY1A4 TaxID=2080522 RepID=UPI000CE8B2E8|nr:hypothetical protein [Rathayibacter sp. AY1A4]PPF13760.1 hypothetical protein C5B92_16175 [Rathayibacter sp. AY1A4]
MSIVEDTHLETWKAEVDSSLAERRWLAWIGDAERAAGHSLDGDQAVDGYSMDFAYEAWELGASPAAYVRSLQKEA